MCLTYNRINYGIKEWTKEYLFLPKRRKKRRNMWWWLINIWWEHVKCYFDIQNRHCLIIASLKFQATGNFMPCTMYLFFFPNLNTQTIFKKDNAHLIFVAVQLYLMTPWTGIIQSSSLCHCIRNQILDINSCLKEDLCQISICIIFPPSLHL